MIKPPRSAPLPQRLMGIGLSLMLLLSMGCARSPQRSYYSLQGPAAAQPRGPAFTPGRMDVVLGPVTLPDSVDRPQIVTRDGENRLAIDDLHRWAQPLSSEVAAVIAASLYRDLGKTTLVGIQGQETAASDPAFRVTVDIQRFEAVPGQSATVEAAWMIRYKNSDPPLRGLSQARESLADTRYETLAKAYARALGRISREMAAAIGSIRPGF